MKLFGKPDRQKQQSSPQIDGSSTSEESEVSNQDMLAKAGLDKKEEKGGWLSKAWKSIKRFGAEAGDSAKHGAVMGTLASTPLMAAGAGVGAAVGGSAGVASGNGKKGAMTGAKVGAGIMALPGALIGAIGGMITRGVDELRVDEKALLAKTADIPSFHVILEQLAHNYAYGRGDMGQLEEWGYRQVEEHEDKGSGFRVVGFAPVDKSATDPDGKPLRPVVAFRGTANGGGAMDDANDQGIGTFQFSRNEKQVEGLLQRTGAGPDVTGHSLGGALAQLAAARFGGLVGNIVTFQSPGINKEDADKIDSKKHKSTHYRAGGDLVSDAGEAFTAGEVFTFDHKGPNSPLSHLSFPLAELNDLRAKHDMDKPIVSGARSSDDTWVREEGSDYNEGSWADKEVQTHSRLMDVDQAEDSEHASTTMVTRVAGVMFGGGRNFAEGSRGLAGKMGVAGRQSSYASAWKAIREIVDGVQRATDIPKCRQLVVNELIKCEVEPQDFGRFISQSEAAMLDALDRSPYNLSTGSSMVG